MGEVYLCDRQDEPEKPVALKVLPKDADPDAKGRFKREILANSFFSHEGALEVYDAGRDDHGNHYLAMEFFDGRDLEKVLDETCRLPAKEAALLAKQVFETLGASHDAGLVHRDVKPANILLSWDGNTAKLMDYGIAVIEDLSEFKDQVFRSMEGGSPGHRNTCPQSKRAATWSRRRPTSTPWGSCSTKCSRGSCPSSRRPLAAT